MSVVEAMREGLTKRQRQREADYAAVVRAAADGRVVDLAHADTVMRDNGKTADDLDADVRRIQRRREQVARRSDILKLAATAPGLRQRIEAANAELQAAEAQHEERCIPLQQQLDAIAAEVPELSAIERDLRESAPADLRERAASIRDESASLLAQRRTVAATEEPQRAAMSVAQHRGDAQEANLAQVRLDRIASTLRDLQSQIDALDVEQRTIDRRMLQA